MPVLKKHKTVRQALRAVEDSPEWPSDNITDRMNMPVHEMVARNLFDMANMRPTSRAEMVMSTRAQKIILDRLNGTRRMGTHPAVRNSKKVEHHDLTTYQGPALPTIEDEGAEPDAE
jgi:hypothetical protein